MDFWRLDRVSYRNHQSFSPHKICFVILQTVSSKFQVVFPAQLEQVSNKLQTPVLKGLESPQNLV